MSDRTQAPATPGREPQEEPSRELLAALGALSPAAVAHLYQVLGEQLPLRERVAVRDVVMELGVMSSFDRYRATTAATKEPETLDWLDARLEEGEVLYDIGANVGVYSLYAALVEPRCQVVAIEPAAPNVAALCLNVEANRVANVAVCSYGVGGKEALTPLHLSTLERGGSMHSTDAEDVECFGETPVLSQTIALVTIDRVAAVFPPPTLIKVDIDGREEEALRGGAATLAADTVRSVLVELNWREGGEPAPVAARLERYGFDLVATGTEHRREERVWRNYIFDRRPAST